MTSKIKYLKLYSLLFLSIFLSLNSFASNYYWVGGSGNWTDYANHWATTSGGNTFYLLAPTPNDDVFFDANSGFNFSSKTITIDPASASCNSMDWTGATNAPVLAGPSSNSLKIYGSLTFIQAMSLSFAGKTYFESTAAGKTLSMAGMAFKNDVYFNGGSGVWTLQDSLVVSGSNTLYLAFGTLITNNQVVRCFNFDLSNSNIRGLDLGSSKLYCGYRFYASNTNNLSFNAGTSSIILNDPNNYLYLYGNLNYYDVTFVQGYSSYQSSVQNGGSFHTLRFLGVGTGYINYTSTIQKAVLSTDVFVNAGCNYDTLQLAAGHTYVFQSSAVQTINSYFDANAGCSNLISIQSGTSGTQASFNKSSGSVVLSYVILRDIKTGGGASFTANNSLNLGNNSGWTINTPPSQSLYWVGGSGNWDDINHWSNLSGGTGGSCVPSPKDNVFFDANSGFTFSSKTVTINAGTAFCNNMDWTGSLNSPVLAGPSSNTLKIYGSLKFIPAMSLNFSGKTYFESTSSGQTITSAGMSFKNDLYFNGGSGVWTLQDSLVISGSNTLYLSFGTLVTNNQVLRCFNFDLSNSNIRGLDLGSSKLYCGYRFYASNTNNLNFNSGTSSIILNDPNNYLYLYGNLNYYDVTFVQGYSSYQSSVQNGGSFHKLSFLGVGTGYVNYTSTIQKAIFSTDVYVNAGCTYDTLQLVAGHTYVFQSSATQTINYLFDANASCSNLISIQAGTSGTQALFNKSAGSVVLTYVILRDIKVGGGASFTANNSLDLGNNSGWTIQTPAAQNLYWVGGSGNWNDVNHWSNASGGSGGSCVPGPTDNVFFDANSGFNFSSKTVSINAGTAFCKNMDWSGALNAPVLSGPSSNTLKIYGSLKFIPSMSLGFSGKTYFESTSAGEKITSAGMAFKNDVYFNGGSGVWTLQDSLVISGSNTLYLAFGTLVTNNQLLRCFNFDLSNNNIRGLDLGSSRVYCGYRFYASNTNNLSFNSGTSSIILNDPNNYLYLYGNLNYYDVTFVQGYSSYQSSVQNGGSFRNLNFLGVGTAYINYASTIQKATFSTSVYVNASCTYDTLILSKGNSFVFQSNSTQNINYELTGSGTAGYPIAVTASSSGTQAQFVKSSGIVCIDYMSIRDCKASGGASFYAGINSTDLGNNSGWAFTSCCATPANPASPIITGNGCGSQTLAFGGNPANTETWYWQGNTCGTSSSLSSTSSITVNNPGTYYLRSKDKASGCWSASCSSVNVTLYNLPLANAGISQKICSGDSVIIGGNPSASGGSGSYTYLWSSSNGLSSAISANPKASASQSVTYTLIVSDANLCSDTDSVYISVKPSPKANAGKSQRICSGKIAVLGGNPSASGGSGVYTYLWSPAVALSAPTASNPSANPTSSTAYVLSVTDSNQCVSTSTIQLDIKPNPIASAGLSNSICKGDSVLIGGSPTASGGSGMYTYLWTPSASLSSAIIANPIAKPTNNTNYIVTVSDTNGCSSISSAGVILKQLPLVDAGNTATINQGDSVQLSAMGGIQFSWTPAASLSNAGISNPYASPSTSTLYTVLVQDGSGCSASDTVTVIVKIPTEISSMLNQDIEFHLYPNPFNTFTNIDIHERKDMDIEIKVYDALGNLILTQKNLHTGNNKIVLGEVAFGTYFYQLISKSGILKSGKLIVE